MIHELNKILKDYSCKIVNLDSNSKDSVVPQNLRNVAIDGSETVANTEKYLKSILKIKLKIIGLINPNIPSYKKLNELKEHQKQLYNQTDLEKKLNTLINLSINPLNHDEDWIVGSMSNIYRKIATEEDKKLFNQFLIKIKINNQELYYKLYNLLINKFPHIEIWLK